MHQKAAPLCLLGHLLWLCPHFTSVPAFGMDASYPVCPFSSQPAQLFLPIPAGLAELFWLPLPRQPLPVTADELHGAWWLSLIPFPSSAEPAGGGAGGGVQGRGCWLSGRCGDRGVEQAPCRAGYVASSVSAAQERVSLGICQKSLHNLSILTPTSLVF